jgi:predicted GH43/DUF377 family glycosyl hydrolase
MKWLKHGIIYKPNGEYWWNKSHASVPTVDLLDDKRWRIYFGARDSNNRSHIGYIDVEAGNPQNVLRQNEEPILPLGRIGTFDDSGMMPSWIVNIAGKKYLYYIGWNVRNTIPYHLSVGLAISEDGGCSFRRFSDGPLFGSTYYEPYFFGSTCVMVEDDVWRVWYMCCTGFEVIRGRTEPYYHIRYAESQDGIEWKRDGTIAIDYKSKDEAGIGRPSVLKENDTYKMWYSYRNATDYRTNLRSSYRIGYAESPDGRRWKRMDEDAGINVSSEGWDSNMIEYSHVFTCRGKKYMVYCGNEFGTSGFGYAELQ